MEHQSVGILMKDSPIAMYTCDNEGYIKAFNKAAARLWGREPLIGQETWWGAIKSYYLDGSVMEPWQSPMAKLVNNEVIDNNEVIIERLDGQRQKALVYPSPLFDRDAISGAFAYVIDITQSDKTDAKQALLSAIVESSDDAIITKDLNGTITSWNKGAEVIFGYSEHEVLGKPITILIPDERLEEETYILSLIRRGQKVDHFQTIRQNKLGESIHISLTVSPIRDRLGHIVGASKIARNITKQAKAEEAIRLYASNLEVLNSIGKSISEKLDVTKIMQYVTDVTTKLTDAAFGCFFYNNPGGASVLYATSGLDNALFDSLKDESLSDLQQETLYKDPYAQAVLNIKDVSKVPDIPLAIYSRLPTMHGLKWTSYLQVPVISLNGNVVGELFFGHPKAGAFDGRHKEMVESIASQASIALDNSKLFEEIKTLNNKKDEFIGLASHELKTPLTSLSGFLQIIQKKSTDPHIDKFIHKAIEQVTKLNRLVSDLLDVTRVENAKLPFHKETFDCGLLLLEVIETFHHIYPKWHIHYEGSLDDLVVYADKQRIEQVIVNLIDNAIKYSPQSNHVFVNISVCHEFIKISVMDNGIGMTEEQQKGLFTRFYRVEENLAKIPGLGLGLYLSEQMITAHGGQLACKSEAGKGSEFSFTLPKVTNQALKHSESIYEKTSSGIGG